MTHWKANRNSHQTTSAILLAVCLNVVMPVLGDETTSEVMVAMDRVSWDTKSDRFSCKLELDLEKNGRIAFVHSAGRRGEFHFFPDSELPAEVLVASRTAPWLTAAQSEWIALESARTSFRLPPEQTHSLADAMGSGLWTTIRVDRKEIVIPTIRWQSVLADYQTCESRLSPMSVAQARDSVLRYAPGQTNLSESQLDFLNKVATYAQFDSRISKILIDGHTDDVGSPIANLQLSRQRASDVAAALTSAGVDRNIMEIRAHGNRYPVTDNNTPEGRDHNRRVTIRVIRQDEQDTP